MSRLQILSLTVLFCVALSVGLVLQTQKMPVVSAAPSAPSTLYLPLVMRGCVVTELIRDGGFESGQANGANPWQTNTNRTVLDNTSTIPSPTSTHSGSWKAWLGGDNLLLQEALTQTVAIPASATNLQVSFWYRVVTAEPPSSPTADSTAVQIRDAGGAVLQTPYTLYDGDANSAWLQKSISVTPGYAGQTIQLAFVTNTDASNITNFFIDDVSVQVCQ